MAGGKTYTETEKLAAMTYAVLHGPVEAGRQLQIPHNTISQWLTRHGGLDEIRRSLEEKVAISLGDARLATALEWVRRVRELPDSELAETFRAMLKEAAPQQTQEQGQQQTQAQQIVVNLYGDGSPSVNGAAEEA